MGPYQRLFLLAVAAGAALAALATMRIFYTFTEGSRYGSEAAFAAVLLGVAVLCLAFAGLRPAAIVTAFIAGAALAAKPLLYPMGKGFEATYRQFGLTSETHLNFIVPGLLLIALGGILLLTMRVKRGSG